MRLLGSYCRQEKDIQVALEPLALHTSQTYALDDDVSIPGAERWPVDLTARLAVAFTLRRSGELDRPEVPEPAPAASPRWTAALGSAVWAGIATGRDHVFAATEAGTLFAISAISCRSIGTAVPGSSPVATTIDMKRDGTWS